MPEVPSHDIEIQDVIESAAASGDVFGKAVICWCRDADRHLSRFAPVPLASLDGSLVSDQGFRLLALPEVKDDLDELATHPRGNALLQRLREFVAAMHKPTTREGAHRLGQHRHDLSDCRALPLNIPGVAKPQGKPYRAVFREEGPPNAPNGAVFIAIGEKIGGDDRVYRRRAAPRQGRDKGVSNATGLDLEVRLQLKTGQRADLVAAINAAQDLGEEQLTARSGDFLPAMVTLHGPPGGSQLPWPWTDLVVIGYDNVDGREALRALAFIVRWASCSGTPAQVRWS